jgi:hypothetical protein
MVGLPFFIYEPKERKILFLPLFPLSKRNI